MALKFHSGLDSATTDQHFLLTFVDLFLLLLWPVPLHSLIYFTCKTSGLPDTAADSFFLFKLLLPLLFPVLAAPLQCGCPERSRCVRLGVTWRYSAGGISVDFPLAWMGTDRKRDVAKGRKKTKGDGIGQMCPLWLTAARILALSWTSCLTPTSISAQRSS